MRREIEDFDISRAFDSVIEGVDYRLSQKGRGAYAGPHETFGIIAEEVAELLDAVRSNDEERVMAELKDLAVAATIGMASGLPADTPAS